MFAFKICSSVTFCKVHYCFAATATFTSVTSTGTATFFSSPCHIGLMWEPLPTLRHMVGDMLLGF